jgi:hypothetical protein
MGIRLLRAHDVDDAVFLVLERDELAELYRLTGDARCRDLRP